MSCPRFWRLVLPVVVMLSRASARPVAAFGGWKRSLASTSGIYHTRPASVAFDTRIRRQAWPRRSCRTRLFSADAFHRNDASRKRHVVLDSIQASFERYILPSDSTSDTVLLVGVSGGCDSVGLLHALVRLLTRTDDDNKFRLPNQPNTVFQLHVVHFNHQQRGEASDGDALFVQALCDKMKLPCHVYDWNASSASFSQDTARQWRRTTMYSLIESLTNGKDQNGVILTAHHGDDSEEAMLLKLIRGVHLTNLVGMDPVITESEDMPKAIIARPMLNVRKADIVDFLESNQLTWREDESNASDKYLRNRVRNELVPLLSDMMGGPNVLQKRLENVSQQSRELNDDLTHRAQVYLKDMNIADVFLIRDDSLGLVEKEALHQWAESRMGFPLPYDQLQRICTQIQDQPHRQTWTLQVGRGWNIVRKGATLTATREGMEEEQVMTVEREIAWTAVEKDGEHDDVNDAVVIDLPKTMDMLDVDYAFMLSDASRFGKSDFLPPWRQNAFPLRDFLRGQKVPLHRRGVAPVIYAKHEDEESSSVVAVFVEKDDDETLFGGRRGKWVIDGRFSLRTENELGQRIHLHPPDH